MPRFIFTMRNKRNKKKWTCNKTRTFKVPISRKTSNSNVVKHKTIRKLRNMSSNERRKILEDKGITQNKNTPDNLIDTILFTLV